MATQCCEASCAPGNQPVDPRFRRVLWIALLVNAVMFGVELSGGLMADSVSLLADAVDFFGDAANYGISLAVLALAPVWRSRAALIKGLTMGGYGTAFLSSARWHGMQPPARFRTPTPWAQSASWRWLRMYPLP